MFTIWTLNFRKKYKRDSKNIRIREWGGIIEGSVFPIKNWRKAAEIHQRRGIRTFRGLEMESSSSISGKRIIYPQLYGFWYIQP